MKVDEVERCPDRLRHYSRDAEEEEKEKEEICIVILQLTSFVLHVRMYPNYSRTIREPVKIVCHPFAPLSHDKMWKERINGFPFVFFGSSTLLA